MPRVVTKQLAFPLAGVGRRGEYREQATPPHVSPWAVNVRGESPIEHRKRGGSRPGLVKFSETDFGSNIAAVLPVTSLDTNGVRFRDLIVIADGVCNSIRSGSVLTLDTSWATAAGESIGTAAGVAIGFDTAVAASVTSAAERYGMLYLADSTLLVWNPNTGIVSTVAATAGEVPTGQSLVCLYRDRLFLSGSNHVWYCSRMGVPTDWELSADMGDVGRAVAGQVDRPGRIGEKITALIPNGDSSLIIATKNGMWLLKGDPTNGSMAMISDEIGVLSQNAWARSPEGLIAFLSNDGIYFVTGDGSPPARWSAERIPDELRQIDASTNTVTMAYEARGRGFHLFITPTVGNGVHWWLDVDNKALWPAILPESFQPTSVARIMDAAGGMSEIVLGCKDGFIRKFDDLAEDDDGEYIPSHVLIGPIRLSSSEMTDAMLAELHGILADNSGLVRWRVVTGRSAEEASDLAVAGIEEALAGTYSDGYSSGEWRDNRNFVARPRARSPWIVIWLSSTARWAYDSVVLRINQLGRLR
jgi:hypothetical protein